MIRVISCLAYEHDHSFVAVAAIVCLAGSAMTLLLFDKTRRLKSDRTSWAILSGIAGGTAIWTTHFVAMLGFDPPVAYSYDALLTVASLVLAIGFTSAGLMVATLRDRLPLIAAGGAIVGLGVSAMHFTGMAGLNAAGRLIWDPGLVAFAVAMGFVLGAAATVANALSRSALSTAFSILLLVFAICSMHFTAMGAATFIPEPIPVPPSNFSSELLAICVVATISVVTGVAFFMIEQRAQKEVLDSFRHAALHDALTGLPNRVGLSGHLSAMLHEASRLRQKAGIVVLDLDRFKEVNDVYGHHVGDALLQAVATRLRDTLGAGEYLARVGGDEFVGTKAGLGSADELDAFAERLTRAVLAPVEIEGRTVSVGASIGLSVYPDHASASEQLIAQADLAMYRAKRSTTQKRCLYEVTMDEGRRMQSVLAADLRQALARNELEVFYQPQVEVETGLIHGYEALLRWNHPRHGVVPAMKFIPIAEETGLIVPIGEWVLRRACREAAAWLEPVFVAVNISPAQLADGSLPRIVQEALLDSGLPARRLELEVTESCIIEDQHKTLQMIRQLRNLGVSIAMDDYGTGYSSLATLQLLTFDKIKIDRSFIAGIFENPASSAIVRATILLARSLGMKTLAEGVERHDQLDFLKEQGCDIAQGYLFGPAQPPAELGLCAPADAVVRAA